MYVLILTLMVKIANAGFGGIAMQEFDSYESCKHAAKAWEVKVKERGRVDSSEYSAICVKK